MVIGLASKASELASNRRTRVAVPLLLSVGLVFVLFRLRSTWQSSHLVVGKVGWGWLAGALLLAACAVIASAGIWLAILLALGGSPRTFWMEIFLQAQLGKYIPGGIWQYAGRAALARTNGLPLRLVGQSLPIELTASACAAAPFSLLLIGWWGVPCAATAFGIATVAASITCVARVSLRLIARTTLLYAIIWPLMGASFWMVARAFDHVPVRELPYYVGAFAAAWIVGLFAIYAPGGLGVRETILVFLLHAKIGSAEAILVAGASRGVLTVADVTAACASLGRTRRRTKRGSVHVVPRT